MLKNETFVPAQPWRAKTRLVPGKAEQAKQAELEVKIELSSREFLAY